MDPFDRARELIDAAHSADPARAADNNPAAQIILVMGFMIPPFDLLDCYFARQSGFAFRRPRSFHSHGDTGTGALG